MTARPDHLRAHPKGQVFDMLTTIHSRGELVWEETSTFLRRGRGSDDAPGGSTFPRRRPTASPGGCRAIWVAGTPRCRATATRSTSTR